MGKAKWHLIVSLSLLVVRVGRWLLSNILQRWSVELSGVFLYLYELMDFNIVGLSPYIAVVRLFDAQLALFGQGEPLSFGSCNWHNSSRLWWLSCLLQWGVVPRSSIHFLPWTQNRLYLAGLVPQWEMVFRNHSLGAYYSCVGLVFIFSIFSRRSQ